ncbi:hypothetical protein C4580_00695 [Candidatus Woesearchaeota archaeon]|nr:MAG: hypothetical protein C4580_00695 [Candidatus Woesearchaeota archaeon]
MRARRSRYAYWWQYAVVIILAFLWMYAHDRAFDAVSFAAGVFSLCGIVILEVLIRRNAVVLVKGGLDIHIVPAKFIPFGEIRAVHVHQRGLAKWLRFGSLEVVTGNGALFFPFVHEPASFAKEVRKYVRA